MAKNFTAAIDIGTQSIRMGLAEDLIQAEILLPKMAVRTKTASEGMRQGCVVEKNEIINSIKKAKLEAEKKINSRIKNALISIGGTGVSGINGSGEIVVSKADLEITDLDLEKITSICEENIPSQSILNRKIIHTIPLGYKLDGKVVVGSPLGMRGTKLEMRCLFVTVLEKHLDDLVGAVEEAGIEVIEIVASPIASSLVLLSKQQKKAGCLLADIGSETVSLTVYENNIPVSIEVLPTGSNHITNDIALGLKISLEEAEHIKRGGLTTTNYPRKKLEEIVEARLSDIFDMIENHLKKINRSGLLPAGIIFSGSGSNIHNIEELAKEHLKLPAKIGSIPPTSSKNNPTDPEWSVVDGLCLLGLNTIENERPIGDMIRKTKYKTKKFFKQFLP